MITFSCECGKRHQVKDELAGKRGKCSCGKALVIPQPAQESHNILRSNAAAKDESVRSAQASFGKQQTLKYIYFGTVTIALACALASAWMSRSDAKATRQTNIALEQKISELSAQTSQSKVQLDAAESKFKEFDAAQQDYGKSLASKERELEQASATIKSLTAKLVAAEKEIQRARKIAVTNQLSVESTNQETARAIGIAREDGGIVFTYNVNQIGSLDNNEWPALVVLLTRANGEVLDEATVRAEDMRRNSGLAGTMVISARAIVSYSRLANSIHRFEITDTERQEIKLGADFQIRFADYSGPNLIDWMALGREAKVSAAVAAFETVGGDFVFQRFVSPIDSETFETAN